MAHKLPTFKSPYASTLTRTGAPPNNPPNGKAASLARLSPEKAAQRRERLKRKALKHGDNVALRASLQAQKASAGAGNVAILQSQIDAISSYKFL